MPAGSCRITPNQRVQAFVSGSVRDPEKRFQNNQNCRKCPPDRHLRQRFCPHIKIKICFHYKKSKNHSQQPSNTRSRTVKSAVEKTERHSHPLRFFDFVKTATQKTMLWSVIAIPLHKKQRNGPLSCRNTSECPPSPPRPQRCRPPERNRKPTAPPRPTQPNHARNALPTRTPPKARLSRRSHRIASPTRSQPKLAFPATPCPTDPRSQRLAHPNTTESPPHRRDLPNRITPATPRPPEHHRIPLPSLQPVPPFTISPIDHARNTTNRTHDKNGFFCPGRSAL